MKRNGAIGILGGMGPEASRHLYNRLIQLSIKKFGAQHNNDFPEIILQSIPVPDFITNIQNKDKAKKILVDRTIALNTLPLSSISIACNTAHLLIDELQQISETIFISMIEEVAKEVSTSGIKKVGILGSPVTLQSKLYQKNLAKYEINCIIPSIIEKNSLEKIIRNVISGKVSVQDKKEIISIAESLRTRGAEGIILGCTELPLVFSKSYKAIKVYNSIDILAMALLRKYYKSNTMQI